MKRVVFSLFIFFQIFTILFICLQIKYKIKNTLGISINTADSKTINIVLGSELKYFFEPKASMVKEEHLDWLSYVPKYTINKDSLNERFDYEVKKNEGTYRIITLGDSFTYGQNVSTQNNWTELLEDQLNNQYTCKKVKKYEVINLGVYAYDIQYEVERFRIRGQKYDPDLVIWTFTDFERILEKMRPLIQQNNTKQNKELEKQGKYYNNWRIAREDMIKKIGFTGIIDFQKIQVKRMDDYYQGKLLYVATPNKIEYVSILKQRARERENSYYFEPKIMWGQKDLFLLDYHFSEEGNKKMMKEIIGNLIRNKLIPCGQ